VANFREGASARNRRPLAARHRLGARGHSFRDLCLDLREGGRVDDGPDVRVQVHRVEQPQAVCLRGEFLHEFLED
jgi:hypothetical protein